MLWNIKERCRNEVLIGMRIESRVTQTNNYQDDDQRHGCGKES
jgi:hypothetical protein